MEILKLSEIAKACGGAYGGKDVEINAVCIDTRKITKGCLFICIRGARFDAHAFIDEALEKGAAAVMISEDIEVNGAYVKVNDTAKALLELSGYYRSKFNIPVVGLTGSVGKTTTKEFTYLVVNAKYNAIKTLGNLNNEIGLPQMLFQIDSAVEAAVIEMGMNHFGEISRLTRAARPTVGIITNVGVSHIENLGSREGILKAKLEILEGLAEGAPLILNGDNDLLSTVKADKHKVYFFGIDCDADFKATDIKEANGETQFTVKYFAKEQKVVIPLIGIHNVYNALAAFAAGYFLGVDPQAAADALSKYEPEGMRQKSTVVNGITCIEDCYNASPDSMRAALQTLSRTKGNKKIAVLSDMLELGEYSKQAHYSVGETAAQNGVDYLLCFGNESKHIIDGAKANGLENAFLFETKEALADKIYELAESSDAIVFKASRGMHLEDVITELYKRWK
ncbi:MAG: UDP-N-acetylmuramoyl-tripeptide--D-alanyl-D-alanine ligase [Eubacterium sp.]|nr:UDP-N-acetylmuramoyl-tripeptide--D-alanyl-D-alanine ligase [Eubacterium sp.]